MRKGRLTLLNTVAISVLLARPGFAMADESAIAAASEYEVKAAFVYNFAKFVEWPQSNRAMTFCVAGPEPAFLALRRVVHGKTIGGRELTMKRLNPGEQARGECQVVFIAWADKKRSASALLALEQQGVLTVGEEDSFLDTGGIIHFLLEDRKIRFEINLTAARKAGLAISSKLLKLATSIREDAPGGRGGRDAMVP